MKSNTGSSAFLKGLRDGLPIGAGYFAVAFGLGIAAQKAGMNALQGFVMSFLNHASAGEYAGVSAIRTGATYLETALLILIANARYLLMSTALSQKLGEKTTFLQRLALGYCVTDEVFGISMAYGDELDPVYTYGSFCVASPGWALGTLLGVLMGNVLPALVPTVATLLGDKFRSEAYAVIAARRLELANRKDFLDHLKETLEN